MILRRLSQHIKDQNWFAVVLDFVIVVAGILIAFQITNWSELQREKTALGRAETAVIGDMLDNYVNAKERIALSQCRKHRLRTLGEQLLQPKDSWAPVTNAGVFDTDLAAFPAVVRSPKRYWKDRIWETELARGSFDLMEPSRRQDIDNIFRAVRAMDTFQVALGDNEAHLKILGQVNELSRAQRHSLFEIVAEIDEQSIAMEQIGQNIVDGIKGLNLTLEDAQRKVLRAKLSSLNTNGSAIYDDCREAITTSFLIEPETGTKP
jgi:hypothetical protein